jgi:DNA-binding response OmpR family regulator
MDKPQKKILIADSQPNYVIGLKNGLISAGYEVSFAEDGDHALNLAREIQPDAILSDVNLPQLDGHAFLQAVRTEKKLKQTPFLFISNQRRVEERIQSISLGADDFIQKPYYVEEVIARIELLLKEVKQYSEHQQQGSFSGNLSEMNLLDLIQTLEVGQKSGILTLKRNGKQGEVRILEGDVVDAIFERYHAEEALDRMFTWTEGVFRVLMTDIASPKLIKSNTKALLESGMEKVKKWDSLKRLLPPLSAVLVPIARIVADKFDQLPPEEQRLVGLFDGLRTILDVLEENPADDLKTLETLHRLFQKGFFKIKELKNDNYEKNSSTKYIAHLKLMLKKHRSLKSPELSLLSLFFLNSSTAASQPAHAEKPGAAEKELERPLLLSISNRIHLTKSEIMMIREKLM